MTSPRTKRRGFIRISEKQHQHNGQALLRSIGALVWTLGTRRRKGDFQGTMQTPGIPDVYALLPARAADQYRSPLWWEVKAVDGASRPEQLAFEQAHAATTATHWIGYVRGTFDALVGWLVAHGYVKAQNVPHYYLRDTRAPVSTETERTQV